MGITKGLCPKWHKNSTPRAPWEITAFLFVAVVSKIVSAVRGFSWGLRHERLAGNLKCIFPDHFGPNGLSQQSYSSMRNILESASVHALAISIKFVRRKTRRRTSVTYSPRHKGNVTSTSSKVLVTIIFLSVASGLYPTGTWYWDKRYPMSDSNVTIKTNTIQR